MAGMSCVWLWHTVTVAFSCISSMDTGMPTMLERPSTTAVLPAIGTLYRFSSSMQPCRVCACL